MSTVIKSIEVDVPASTAFRELTRFEDLPRFMRGVVAVQQIDDRRLSWRAHIFGAERVWELEITEIAHEHELAWVSRSGPKACRRLLGRTTSTSMPCVRTESMRQSRRG